MPALFESQVSSLPLIHKGKVRDIYAVDDHHMLIVTTDRLSAFDVILPTPIPDKGRVLTQISAFWFDRLSHVVPNQLCDLTLADVISDATERAPLTGRSVVVKRLKALPVEAVVRGYLIGSGWKSYQTDGTVCGITLPPGLKMADRLPEPLYTPSTKAEVGAHDENVDYAHTERTLGPEVAAQVRDTALALYKEAAAYALERGIIIADTKFEFGLDEQGVLHLIDEALTPDSSRFWPADTYEPGMSPPSFDKQYLRDYLETLDWDKTDPGPTLPEEVVSQVAARYQEALERLTGQTLAD
ncbi:phosphoribosylaminoimidazolesuccinocarboxamide synthase [Ectothiorhodospira variabilis]|uniref:phosphoribosylaminoimidazolesuccinocarboxamide synthase n=1 Tax=Ectothiorhodospira variabilis TaxID=505694 RepID=UPI001EFA5AAC|nr:phosphoribosylaminoimidazolesuccinocarboxamide synthase [Ectothiorhodospira variabilis]MCG5494382.1 phosphoribosylaminoimidazolesuccinocarboxamide synthase [Ectothiorhodospira variabilis]MCG5504149.1 phosphoribosylaminoimidazolesuccinocarboxamide synthase [Ectothiorhodospira variabilis]MCG5507304.1 phosphoribosylaminoimidazolesuccinocarboxamide synthase [Ectothiorhodospira variabilis]